MKYLVALIALLPAAAMGLPLTLSNVQAEPRQVQASDNFSITIRFSLSLPGTVTARIYDGRELLIREIEAGSLKAGEHTIQWDGKDARGRAIPPEAYTYTLVAQGKGARVVYDIADATGGQDLVPLAVTWDADAGVLSYVLDKAARVNIRVGLKNNGPVLNTLIDWVVRPAGLQREPWDGRDASGVLQLAKHPQLDFAVQAFALADNTILVGPAQKEVQLIEPLEWTRESRPATAVAAKRMHAHAQQPLESRGDMTVKLILPDTLPRLTDGTAVVTGSRIPVRLEIDQADLERALARRFEPVMFVDGQYAFENEVGFVPMTWMWDATSVNAGEHFLTVNVRGYEGNFGIASVKVVKQ